MTTVPRSPDCGSVCVANHPSAPSGQYAGAPGAPPPLHYGSDALPFTGFDASALIASVLGFIVLAAVLYASARSLCWLCGGEWD